MRRFRSMLKPVSLCLAVVLAMAMLATPAMAADVIHLKDGRVLEGKIARELANGAIYFEIEVGSLKSGNWYNADEIESIERDAEMHAQVEAAAKRAEADAAIPDGATRIAFISLEEEVGPFFNKNAIEHSIGILDDLPDNQKPQIVVFVIDSGGGALYELMQIAPYIQEEVKPKYRTVAWIRSAISAAAMTAWVIPEIYMMREGNIGACTGFSMANGTATAVEGDDLERVLMFMEQVSVWGDHEPNVMRAMQILETLSATKHQDGTVEWFLDDSGEELVSPKSEILTFSSIEAVKWNIAQGIADSKDELAKEMGCAEWVEVGQKADEYQQEFRENVGTAQVKIEEHWNKLNIALSYAEGAPTKRERDRNIGEARRHLGEMRAWVRRAPSLEFYMNLTPKFFRDMERKLRDLAHGGEG